MIGSTFIMSLKPVVTSYASNSRNLGATQNVSTLLSLLNLIVLLNCPYYHVRVHESCVVTSFVPVFGFVSD